MSLFGDLPAPSAKRERDDDDTNANASQDKRLKPEQTASKPLQQPIINAEVNINDIDALSDGGGSSDGGDEYEEEQQHKQVANIPVETIVQTKPAPSIEQPRQRQQLEPPVENQQQPTATDNVDQVSAALLRITGHISNPKKFSKASELLTKLFNENVFIPAKHGNLVFAALEASMSDPQTSHEPILARDYSKLFTLASRHIDLFTTEQRSVLDVYGIWAVVRNKMLTDDSFVFNKVVSQIKEMIQDLPQVVENTPSSETTTTPIEDKVLNQRREALLDCIETGKSCYKNAWARTSVDLLIEHAKAHSDKFTTAQQPRIDEFVAFVRDQKSIRKLGPSAKETARDVTSFEKARQAWGDANWISKRGKIGGGDAKTQQWLG